MPSWRGQEKLYLYLNTKNNIIVFMHCVSSHRKTYITHLTFDCLNMNINLP
jgi:hypothetical protein